MSLQRYRVTDWYDSDTEGCVIEKADGNWVHWSDVEPLLAELTELRRRQAMRVDMLEERLTWIAGEKKRLEDAFDRGRRDALELIADGLVHNTSRAVLSAWDAEAAHNLMRASPGLVKAIGELREVLG